MFVSPPLPDEVAGDGPLPEYRYNRFPDKLNPALFPQRDQPDAQNGDAHTENVDKKMFIARRSKAEIKAALKVSVK